MSNSTTIISSHDYLNLGYSAHIFGGITTIISPILLLDTVFSYKWILFITWILGIIFVLIKELWYDVTYQIPKEAGSATLDIITYMAGAIIGTILIFVQIYLHTKRKPYQTLTN